MSKLLKESNELNELDELFNSKQIVTDILAQKLNIWNLAKNTLCQYEFRDCVEAFCNRLESILDSKSLEFKESFIQNSTNPASYVKSYIKCANILKIPESGYNHNLVYSMLKIITKYIKYFKDTQNDYIYDRYSFINFIPTDKLEESSKSDLYTIGDIKIYKKFLNESCLEMCSVENPELSFKGWIINLKYIQKYYKFLVYVLGEYRVGIFIWNFDSQYLFIDDLDSYALSETKHIPNPSNFNEFNIILNKCLELYPDSLIQLDLGSFTNKEYPNTNFGIDMCL